MATESDRRSRDLQRVEWCAHAQPEVVGLLTGSDDMKRHP